MKKSFLGYNVQHLKSDTFTHTQPPTDGLGSDQAASHQAW